MEYFNFDLRIEPGTPYRLIAESPEVGEAEGELAIDVDDPEIKEALDRLARRDTDNEFLTRLGNLLFRRLFNDEIGARFEQSTGFMLAKRRRGLRLRLRIAPPDMAVVPWELLYTPSRDFLGTSETSPIVRWLSVAKPIRDLATTLPLRILVAIPRIQAPYPELDANKEIACLNEALKGLQGSVEMTVLKDVVSLKNIDHALIEKPYHVFHFIGHAEFENDRGVLLLNTDEGGMELVDEKRFARVFVDHAPMKLIVLNACQGAQVSPTRPFIGIAPQLVRLGIPAVVAMQFSIYDEAAVVFAREFYFALFQGPNAGRIDWALSHARNTLAREFPDDREAATPVLFMRAPEGVLFYPETGNRLRDAAFSKQARDTEKAVDATHRYNQKLAGNKEAEQDPNLAQHLHQDREQYTQLKERIKFRNRLVGVSALLFCFVFMLSWVRLFDILWLDTLVQGLTFAVSDKLTEKPAFADDIRIVTLNKKVGWDWREKHAVLLDRLVEAGAQVVVFDLFFNPSDTEESDMVVAARLQGTRKFARSIRAARESGTPVILGFNAFDGRRPRIVEDLRDAVGPGRLGALCLSGKLGFIGIAPLLIEKRGKHRDEMQWPSLALAAFVALRGASELSVEWPERKIRFVPLDLTPITFSGQRTAIGGEACSANAKGDLDADLFIDLSPAHVIRDEDRSIPYETIVGGQDMEALGTRFAGSIVFVGQTVSGEDYHNVFDLETGQRYGVELQADAFNTLMQIEAGFPVIRAAPLIAQTAVTIAMVLLGAFIRFWVPKSSRGLRLILVAGIFATYIASMLLLSINYRVLLDSLYHVSAFGLAYVLAGWIERRWLA